MPAAGSGVVFQGFGLDPLVLVKVNVNATAQKDISNNSPLPKVAIVLGMLLPVPV